MKQSCPSWVIFIPAMNKKAQVCTPVFYQNRFFPSDTNKRITELQSEIGELQAQTEQLTQLKSQIAATYYNDPAATPDTATTEQVKTAILQLISDLGGTHPN